MVDVKCTRRPRAGAWAMLVRHLLCMDEEMHERADIATSIALPSPDAAAAYVRDARRLFERTLSGWAMDALTLRRSGASEFHWHEPAARRHPCSARYRKAA